MPPDRPIQETESKSLLARLLVTRALEACRVRETCGNWLRHIAFVEPDSETQIKSDYRRQAEFRGSLMVETSNGTLSRHLIPQTHAFSFKLQDARGTSFLGNGVLLLRHLVTARRQDAVPQQKPRPFPINDPTA